jgi:20S proteasome alpha/beta subunit
VTICIATLFHWNYSPNATPLHRMCALVASDRKITAGDVEYEPAQQKFAQMTPSTILLVSGDISVVHIYAIDKNGMIACWDDVGFAAIGSGAWHAKSLLMQAGYVNKAIFAPALALTFAAKKASEIALGVGKETDIKIVSACRMERS